MTIMMSTPLRIYNDGEPLEDFVENWWPTHYVGLAFRPEARENELTWITRAATIETEPLIVKRNRKGPPA